MRLVARLHGGGHFVRRRRTSRCIKQSYIPADVDSHSSTPIRWLAPPLSTSKMITAPSSFLVELDFYKVITDVSVSGGR
eukprot:1147830-Amphidinium_carterae.1